MITIPERRSLRAALAVALLALSGPAVAKDACGDAAKVSEAAALLKGYYDADRTEHEGTRPDDLVARDKGRVKEVQKVVDKGLVCSPEASLHAAWVLQRSLEAEQLGKAHELAKVAMEARVHGGAYLAAVTYDLHQVSRGAKQRYATQMATMYGKHCIFPVAEDSTDEERAQYGLPPLADAFRRLLDANGMNQDPATVESINKRLLWCESKPWE